MEYGSLAMALQEIAERSFYESATLYANESGFYVVDDVRFYNVEEIIMWTYDNGMELPSTVIEHSRLHESYETYESYKHIEYNIPNVADLITEGKKLHFDYVVVESYPETEEDKADNEVGAYDGLVGWALIVTED